jgi:ribosomal protein L10
MNAQTKYVRDKPIPEGKLALVKELSSKMKTSRTVLVASCKSLPGQQFHDIKKQLRGKAELKSARKSSVQRAIDSTGKGSMKELKEQFKSDCVLLFSEMDPFALSGLLTDSQSETKARAGDIAPYDIEIEPGPTELIPGPAISELGAVGLKVAVKDGKLEIIKGAVVAKEGTAITDKVAGVLAKLGINPMKVGFLPLAAYDSHDDKTYVGIRIDKTGTLESLRDLIKKALGFSVSVDYPVKENISYFISMAAAEEKAFEKIVGGEKKVDVSVENSSSQDTATKEDI